MNIKLLLVISITLLLHSCGGSKKVTSLQTGIETAYQNNNHELVINQYKELESIKKETDAPLSNELKIMVAKSFYHSQQFTEAILLFSDADDISSDIDAIGMKGICYEKTGDNISEFQHWKHHLNALLNSKFYKHALERLYTMEVANENYKEANELWKGLMPTENLDLLFNQVTVLAAINKNSEALKLCNNILSANKNHEQALFWKAKFYYNKAENWYQDEMTKYNRDANYTAYAYLRRELKKISADYRVSRDMFIELRKIAPENRFYIQYLRNIYVRLEMRDEASRMDQLLNQ